MENLWELVAKARGVELGEEFVYTWNNFKYKYRITERCLEYYNEGAGRWVYSNCSSEFIKGEGKIERLPFRPQKGEIYYSIDRYNSAWGYDWTNTTVDYERLIAGLVFRTIEEAEAYIPTWIERINKL